jgi:hypothetical protein
LPISGDAPHPGGATLLLAAAAPTVTLARDTTPEPRSWARDIDQALTLPKWLGAFVRDDAHAAAARKLPMIRGLAIPAQASEDRNREPAGDGEPFQDPLDAGHRRVGGGARSGDGPRVRAAPASGPGRDGEPKTDRMAAVGAVDTIDPFARTSDELIDALPRKTAGRRRPRPPPTRVRADLRRGKVTLFLGRADALCRQRAYLPEGVRCLLDLRHVMEQLWKAAWCLCDEKTQKAQAEQWVEDRPRRLLDGEVGGVSGGRRRTLTTRPFRGSRRTTMRAVIGEFDRNRSRMRDDASLAAGDPIGRGVIAGASRHLVKDRLERAGRRGPPDGTQAMRDLRATSLNGAWEAFWASPGEQEDDRLDGKLRPIG